MTVGRWEYAAVAWSNAARRITKTDPEYEQLPPKAKSEWEANDWTSYWWIDQIYAIWLPGATKPDIRHGWSTGDETYKTSMLEILNELGGEGWEVVVQNVKASAVGTHLGRDRAGYPIEISTLLKRPAAA